MPHSRSLSSSTREAFQNEVVLLQQLRDRDSVIQVLNLRMLMGSAAMKKCKDGFLGGKKTGGTKRWRNKNTQAFLCLIYIYIYFVYTYLFIDSCLLFFQFIYLP